MQIYKAYAAKLLRAAVGDIGEGELAGMFEYPPEGKMGDLALPCFRLSKILRKSPVQIADALSGQFSKHPESARVFHRVESVSGYLNLYISDQSLAERLTIVRGEGKAYGSSREGQGKTVVLDYSAPNIAKPFHIGHLRSTVIGQSLKNIFRFSGYQCVGVNHLGDWGTQFGKLIVAFRMWGDKEEIEKKGIKALTDIYVRFHKEAEIDESLNEKAREAFRRMEERDRDALQLWEWFVRISIAQFKEIYALIGADFESWHGESFYFDKTDAVISRLEEKNLLSLDNGAHIVSLDDYDMPPCLILKSDGSTIYATRDIAAAIYRKQTYDFDKCIYVTSAGQSLHFAQFFKVLELMGYEWARFLVHVPFGTVSIGGEKLATRTGNVILLEDLFSEAIEKTLAIMNEKNPDLDGKEEVAKAVGVGAVIFHDLLNNRVKDVNFIWDEVLNFDGNTGPYVQYTYARCAGIIEKSGHTASPDAFLFTEKHETDLMKTLLFFPEKVRQAREELEPSVISRYLLDLCQDFNRFYHECPVLKAKNEQIRGTRLALVAACADVLDNGLALIGLKRPKNI